MELLFMNLILVYLLEEHAVPPIIIFSVDESVITIVQQKYLPQKSKKKSVLLGKVQKRHYMVFYERHVPKYLQSNYFPSH